MIAKLRYLLSFDAFCRGCLVYQQTLIAAGLAPLLLTPPAWQLMSHTLYDLPASPHYGAGMDGPLAPAGSVAATAC